MQNYADLKVMLTAIFLTFWTTSASYGIECELESASSLSSDNLSLEPVAEYSDLVGDKFEIDLQSGSILNLPELDGHSWKIFNYKPNPEMGSYSTRLESTTLPRTYAQFNVAETDQEEAGANYRFFITVDEGTSYFSRCNTSPDN